MLKVLYIRKIGIDIIPNDYHWDSNINIDNIYIDLHIDLRIINEDTGKVMQLITDYGRMYKKIFELPSIPIDNFAVDGVIDSKELFSLVGKAAIIWVRDEYNGVIDEKGRLII